VVTDETAGTGNENASLVRHQSAFPRSSKW
jgi:hypothetical protein